MISNDSSKDEEYSKWDNILYGYIFLLFFIVAIFKVRDFISCFLLIFGVLLSCYVSGFLSGVINLNDTVDRILCFIFTSLFFTYFYLNV